MYQFFLLGAQDEISLSFIKAVHLQQPLEQYSDHHLVQELNKNHLGMTHPPAPLRMSVPKSGIQLERSTAIDEHQTSPLEPIASHQPPSSPMKSPKDSQNIDNEDEINN